MKYGVLVITPVSSQKDRSYINLGDWMQTEAVLYIYERMGIKREDVVRIELTEIHRYDGEYLLLPININLSFNWIIDIIPLPPRIIPVFLGLSYFSAQRLPQELADYFRFYAPIGCRDEFTMEIMRANHIPAYLYGCVTAAMPRVEHAGEGDKIFFVDVPESFEEYYRGHEGELSGEIVRVSHIRNGKEVRDKNYVEKTVNELWETYKTQAKLVVTSRLHCMSPCMSAGIPVIPVTDNLSPRMGWIDRYLRIFTPETYSMIQWEGQTVFYEDRKAQMLDIAIARIKETVQRFGEAADLSYFYEIRDRSPYGNYYRKVLERLPEERKGSFDYVLWGAGQIGMNVYQVIQEIYPDSRCIAVIDSYCTGEFFGVPILKPEALKEYTKEYVFITTWSGEACAKEMLAKMGKRETVDFLSMATTAG